MTISKRQRWCISLTAGDMGDNICLLIKRLSLFKTKRRTVGRVSNTFEYPTFKVEKLGWVYALHTFYKIMHPRYFIVQSPGRLLKFI